MSEAPVRTICPYCGVGCGVIADGGTVVGDPNHPANRGLLCSKGAALAETLDDRARLSRPQIAGRDAEWDEALDLIAARCSTTIEEHGPDAVALYVSGQFLTEDYYVANKLMKGFIGSANIDTNSRLCMASSVAGHVRAFGEDLVPGCYEDVEQADLVVLVGSNAAWCHPVLYRRLAVAREKRQTRIVVIDPRRTATCDIADLHLAIRPGSDVAIFGALLRHLADNGSCDPAWIGTHTSGFTEARAAAPTLAEASVIADVPADDLQTFFDWFAATERAVTLYSQGVNQSSSGTDKVNAIVNCHLATGRIGRAGMGPLSLTGQPNAMGGREVGGLANQLAAHMHFTPSDIDRVRRFWGTRSIATGPGLKAVELFDALLDGRVKAVWILGTNPAASMPRAGRVREALAACPFVVVTDCWPTDTTALAQVVLPAAAWGEKDGTVTNSERCISRQRPFRRSIGEARPDWWMLCQVARRMGWQEAFAYRKPADIFREHAALSGFENDGQRVFDVGAFARLSDEEYERLEPVYWPLSADGGQPWSEPKRLFGRGQFAGDDRRARFVSVRYRPAAVPPDDLWPLVLNTGRIRDQWHTMTRTGLAPGLMAHQQEPLLDTHPADAARLRLVDGGLARIESRHGTEIIRVRVSDRQRVGEMFAPMHWTDRFASAGPIAKLVGAATDPVSGQPELKATPVRVEPVAASWHGVLLGRCERTLSGDFYWSRVPIETGQAFTLTGWTELPRGPDSEAWVVGLLGAPSRAELVIYADPARGTFRYASILDDRLDGCLLLARTADALPSTNALAGMLDGTMVRGRREDLLGCAAGAAVADTGPTVCACFAVGLRLLHRTIAEHGVTTVAELGDLLRAGTNCGSCLPELRSILAAASTIGRPVAA